MDSDLQSLIFDMSQIADEHPDKLILRDLAAKHNAHVGRSMEVGRLVNFIVGQTQEERTRFGRMIRNLHKYLPFTDKFPAYTILVSVVFFCLTTSLKALGFDLRVIGEFFEQHLHTIIEVVLH